MRVRCLWLALLMAGCTAEPRAASYFEAHLQEAEQVVRDCAAGSDRGLECDNAQAAVAARKRAVRIEQHRKGFE